MNRKSYYSMNVQAVADFDLLFMDITVGWPGSVHDARVFRDSHLFRCGENGTLFPTATAASFFGGIRVPWRILGDSAYPSKDWLLVPYKDNGTLTQHSRFYDYIHSSTRMVVERAFGRLKCSALDYSEGQV
ncbi:hypothetical protein CYMTET_54210 [Cymbomonas tetramitiformis]|uniref:DDE Tnp4 domain-containing protein n=1 Tax=Cymbomonas tetramitiformis TaxID=36881 RepID=A0AAE0BFF7_9CHLO|nr:hypothetical protein CYMTET_54210 [Cymbomonas tetramitiformis]